MRPGTTPLKIRLAWAVAVGIDALQVFLLPATVEGGFSPVEVFLDVLAMGLLWALLGWSWAFLPSFVMELVPFIDITPTWTLAVLVATRGGRSAVPVPGEGPDLGHHDAGEKPPPKVVEAVVLPPEEPRA